MFPNVVQCPTLDQRPYCSLFLVVVAEVWHLMWGDMLWEACCHLQIWKSSQQFVPEAQTPVAIQFLPCHLFIAQMLPYYCCRSTGNDATSFYY